MSTNEIDQSSLADLARKVGVDPSQSATFQGNAENSMPLLVSIQGDRGYLGKLRDAAFSMHKLLVGNTELQQLAGTRFFLGNGDHGAFEVPAVPPRPKPEYIDAMQKLLHSLAHAASHPLRIVNDRPQRNEYVAIPLDRNEFGKGSRYEELSYAAFVRVVRLLAVYRPDEASRTYLEYVPGYYDRSTGEGRRSRVGASREFKDWLVRKGLVLPGHPHHRKPAKPAKDPCLLWISGNSDVDGENKTPLERPLEGDERILPSLNAKLARQRLSCPLPDYAFYDTHYDYKKGRSNLELGVSKTLYRVFSGSDGRAGRLYGHWVQGLPQPARRLLRINDQPVIEADYSNMQLVLLYALNSVERPDADDLYAMPGMAGDRDLMKMVLTLSVGNSTRSETLGAIRKHLVGQGLARPGKAEELYDSFWYHHNAVNPHAAGVEAPWAKLQYEDSRIALRVLGHLLDVGIVAIPIHDSFIVQQHHGELLVEAMYRAFEDFWPGVAIRIDVKQPVC